MTSKYLLFIGKDRQYYFSLHAVNDQVILQSEGYTTKQSALNGISSCRTNSPYDARYSKHGAAPSCWFRLNGGNGEPIGRSETYTTTQARDIGIESVKTNGPLAPLDDRA